MELADHLEQQFERHGPGERTVRLSLTDDGFPRSYSWTRWQVGVSLTADG